MTRLDSLKLAITAKLKAEHRPSKTIAAIMAKIDAARRVSETAALRECAKYIKIEGGE